MNPFGVKEIQELYKVANDLKNTIKAFENVKGGVQEMSKATNDLRPRHISTINEGFMGNTYLGTNVEYRKHVFMLNGERVEGVFPKFNSKFDTVLPKNLRNASDTEQFRYCTQALKNQIGKNSELAKQFNSRQINQIKDGAPRISGLTWHHNEVPGKMQLVNDVEHSTCRHTGGRSIWGGGSDYR